MSTATKSQSSRASKKPGQSGPLSADELRKIDAYWRA